MFEQYKNKVKAAEEVEMKETPSENNSEWEEANVEVTSKQPKKETDANIEEDEEEQKNSEAIKLIVFSS